MDTKNSSGIDFLEKLNYDEVIKEAVFMTKIRIKALFLEASLLLVVNRLAYRLSLLFGNLMLLMVIGYLSIGAISISGVGLIYLLLFCLLFSYTLVSLIYSWRQIRIHKKYYDWILENIKVRLDGLILALESASNYSLITFLAYLGISITLTMIIARVQISLLVTTTVLWWLVIDRLVSFILYRHTKILLEKRESIKVSYLEELVYLSVISSLFHVSEQNLHLSEEDIEDIIGYIKPFMSDEDIDRSRSVLVGKEIAYDSFTIKLLAKGAFERLINSLHPLSVIDRILNGGLMRIYDHLARLFPIVELRDKIMLIKTTMDLENDNISPEEYLRFLRELLAKYGDIGNIIFQEEEGMNPIRRLFRKYEWLFSAIFGFIFQYIGTLLFTVIGQLKIALLIIIFVTLFLVLLVMDRAIKPFVCRDEQDPVNILAKYFIHDTTAYYKFAIKADR